MHLLEPRWDQVKPTLEAAQEMCRRVGITYTKARPKNVENVLHYLTKSYSNGGALFAEFHIGPSDVFDWFASRNRLAEFSILPYLLRRREVQEHVPELLISSEIDLRPGQCSPTDVDGFTMESSFLLDGRIAQALYEGGAYGQSELDGRAAKQLAIAFCEELFEQRYSEIVLFSNFMPWTQWFRGIAWDWTAFVFDRRKRNFAILALTDTD